MNANGCGPSIELYSRPRPLRYFIIRSHHKLSSEFEMTCVVDEN